MVIEMKLFGRAALSGTLLLVHGLCALAQSEVLFIWTDAAGNHLNECPSTGHSIHLRMLQEGISFALSDSEIIQFDSTGYSFQDLSNGVYQLESIPWTWTAVIEPRSFRDTLLLVCPTQKPTALRGNQASVLYPQDHPGTRLQEWRGWMASQLDSLEMDRLIVTGSVGGGGSDELQAFRNLQLAEERGEEYLFGKMLVAPHTLWGDLWEASILEWQGNLGVSNAGDELTDSLNRSDDRSWEARLRSPGWCSMWQLRNDQWWDQLEDERRPWKSWVASGNGDSLCAAMNWSLDELHMAIWMGKDEVWGRWADAWWEGKRDDSCAVAECRRTSEKRGSYALSASSWKDGFWQLPDGHQEAGDAGKGTWTIWAITHSKSSAAVRELAILRNWMDNHPDNPFEWGIISIDDSWHWYNQTLTGLRSKDEQAYWVGEDPDWWDRLDVRVVPQFVVVRPDGSIQTHHASPPSDGLFAELKRWMILAR